MVRSMPKKGDLSSVVYGVVCSTCEANLCEKKKDNVVILFWVDV